MSEYNTIQTFRAFLKTKYASRVINTLPQSYKAQRMAPFNRSDSTGLRIEQPVIANLEQGGTYRGPNAGAFDLNKPIAAKIKNMVLDATNFVLQSAIDYETLFKSTKGGAVAYRSGAEQLFRSMVASARKRLELSLWHGRSGIGTLYSEPDGIITDLKINNADWAIGNYLGMENAAIHFADPTALTVRNFTDNSDYTADLSAAGSTIKSVDPVNRTITVTAAPVAAVAKDDLVVLSSQIDAVNSTWQDMQGIYSILNTTSGILFGIDLDTTSTFVPNSYDVSTQDPAGSALTFDDVQKAAITSINKGLDSAADFCTSNESWVDLLTEQAAFREYDGGYSGQIKFINGDRGIRFLSANGVIDIEPSIYCKVGSNVLGPKQSWRRIGNAPVTFDLPGVGQNVHIAETVAGVIFRCVWNQSLVTEVPGHMTLVTGITSDFDASQP